MKNEFIEQVLPFDEKNMSINQYEDDVLKIIELRLNELKKIESNEWSQMSDNAYELLNAYKFLIDALVKNGLLSRGIKYANISIEYCQMYQKYIEDFQMKRYSDFFKMVINKIRG